MDIEIKLARAPVKGWNFSTAQDPHSNVKSSSSAQLPSSSSWRWSFLQFTSWPYHHDTARIHDIFIIFMALESLLLGVSLILPSSNWPPVQPASNEIKPILQSIGETISTLRARPLSTRTWSNCDNLNEYLAALRQFFSLINLVAGEQKISHPYAIRRRG
jgi:hypothetical protein